MELQKTEQSDQSVHALQLLLNGFAEGDLGKVRQALNQLGNGNKAELHESICAMTEKFHATLDVFKSRLDPANLTMTTTNIPDAAKKLEYVLQASNDSTMKLFSFLEKIEANFSSTEEQLNTLKTDDPEVLKFIELQKDKLADNKKILSEIVMVQEYQDLCGQALSKVLKLVREVEETLKDLVKQFGIEAKSDGDTLSPDDTKYGQDEADALLKELGF